MPSTMLLHRVNILACLLLVAVLCCGTPARAVESWASFGGGYHHDRVIPIPFTMGAIQKAFEIDVEEDVATLVEYAQFKQMQVRPVASSQGLLSYCGRSSSPVVGQLYTVYICSWDFSGQLRWVLNAGLSTEHPSALAVAVPDADRGQYFLFTRHCTDDPNGDCSELVVALDDAESGASVHLVRKMGSAPRTAARGAGVAMDADGSTYVLTAQYLYKFNDLFDVAMNNTGMWAWTAPDAPFIYSYNNGREGLSLLPAGQHGNRETLVAFVSMCPENPDGDEHTLLYLINSCRGTTTQKLSFEKSVLLQPIYMLPRQDPTQLDILLNALADKDYVEVAVVSWHVRLEDSTCSPTDVGTFGNETVIREPGPAAENVAFHSRMTVLPVKDPDPSSWDFMVLSQSQKSLTVAYRDRHDGFAEYSARKILQPAKSLPEGVYTDVQAFKNGAAIMLALNYDDDEAVNKMEFVPIDLKPCLSAAKCQADSVQLGSVPLWSENENASKLKFTGILYRAPYFMVYTSTSFVGFMTTACPAGQEEATDGCFPCQAGQRVETVPHTGQELHRCVDCPVGYASDTISSATCTQCPPYFGTFTTGTVNCTTCDGGLEFQQNGTECVLCAAGKSREEPLPGNLGLLTPPDCTVCEAGRYSSSGGAKECDFCDPGRAQAGKGHTDCALCEPGEVAVYAGQHHCEACDPGRVSNVTGGRECVACGHGSSQNKSGQAQCILCSNGKFADTIGLDKCQDCPLGPISNTGEGATSADACVCPKHTKNHLRQCECIAEWAPGMTADGLHECVKCLPGEHSLGVMCVTCGADEHWNTEVGCVEDDPWYATFWGICLLTLGCTGVVALGIAGRSRQSRARILGKLFKQVEMNTILSDPLHNAISDDEIFKIRENGHGAFGVAYIGTHCTYPGNYNGSEVAVKEITLQNRRLDDVEFLAELQLEAQALKAFRHRNVVRYFGLLQGWVLGKRYLKGIVTEFCERGALSDLIFSDQFANLSLQTKLRIACDVIQGLAFLHAQGFLHRDIQCENVLLDSAGTAKLTGLSKLLGDQLEGKSATGEVRVVIPDGKEPLLQMHNISEVEKFSGDSKRRNTQKGWQAPELLSGKKVTYTSKMDIYAYGCLLYCLVTGHQPWHHVHDVLDVQKRVAAGELPVLSGCSARWRRLIEDCLTHDPEFRPDAAEIEFRVSAWTESL